MKAIILTTLFISALISCSDSPSQDEIPDSPESNSDNRSPPKTQHAVIKAETIDTTTMDSISKANYDKYYK